MSASACDMHGGMFSSLSGADWQSFSPRVSTMDPALADATRIPPARAKKVKPTFSFAAKKASMKAMSAKKEASKASDAPAKATVKKASLETDR